MTTATKRVFHCARCARKLAADRYVYSRHTGARYCLDLDACGKRAKRKVTA